MLQLGGVGISAGLAFSAGLKLGGTFKSGAPDSLLAVFQSLEQVLSQLGCLFCARRRSGCL